VDAIPEAAADLKKFDKLRPEKGSLTLTTATELGHPDAPPTFVRFGGVHERPTDEVQPALPVAVRAGANAKLEIKPTATSSGRRTALAKWLASPDNPLDGARVRQPRLVASTSPNGIVGTVADFGRAGQKPTHPELLDYLATDFVKQGWSVKKLQREILLSSVYRQSSGQRDDVLKVDPDNKLLAVYPAQTPGSRRDPRLVAGGIRPAGRQGRRSEPYSRRCRRIFNAGNLWTASLDPAEQNRRSVYVFVRRSVPYPLMQSFDLANPSHAHHKRDVTTTPLQALTLFNSDVVFGWSQALAGRVIREAGKDESAQINTSVRDHCLPAFRTRTKRSR
jgi:hypothetical protein